MHAAELALHRKNTRAFIAADPLQIELVRSVKSRTSSGGVSQTAPTTIGAQTLRLIPASGPAADVRLTSGRIATQVYTLMGEWDVDVERDDDFELNGVWYTVAGPIQPEHSSDSRYELKAPVVRRG